MNHASPLVRLIRTSSRAILALGAVAVLAGTPCTEANRFQQPDGVWVVSFYGADGTLHIVSNNYYRHYEEAGCTTARELPA